MRYLTAVGSAAVLGVGLLSSSAFAQAPPASGTPVPPQQRLYPTNLPQKLVHPGSAIVAFKTPVQAKGARFTPAPSGSASSSDVSALNQTLASLGTTKVVKLFTNVPAAQLNAARAQAERATGQYMTDFTQVYQVSYDPVVNSGTAANDIAQSTLVSAAMPDWIYHAPKDRAKLTKAQRTSALKALAKAKVAQSPSSLSATALPANAAYANDAQSYLDGASDNVTGAAAMLATRFGQQPGQGETVTNISLGTIDDSSTVVENGQRYIVMAGYPKIPVWLSSANCSDNGHGTQTCDVTLDPDATNTTDGQGDLLEVNLDFSVMAPPPLGDPRLANPAPPGNGQLLGEAYGADYRLINPLVNNTENFVGAWLGATFLQTPKPDVITASIGNGFSIGGFSDYFFENEAIIHDAVTEIVQGADVFVSISAGDGQTETSVAMNPNGLTGPTDVTTDPNLLTDIDDPNAWANPMFSYGLTVEPQYVIDSGSTDAGADTLNDVFNDSPFNTAIKPKVSHAQHTTETRWTGQQNFHTGNGSRVNLSAPGDAILFLGQVEDANGIPVNPIASYPRLIGGSSASAPQIAGAAAVVRQTARLLGIQLTAPQVRQLLIDSGRPNLTPAFDLSNANIGPNLDLTAAVQQLFDQARANSQAPQLVRMTVAQRKAALTPTDLRSAFYTDTTQNPRQNTATIDLSQGLVAPSSRTNETIGASGDNVNAPITFAVDAAFVPRNALKLKWTLQLGGKKAVKVPKADYDPGTPSLRLLPSEIFAALGQPTTSRSDRTVIVTATSGKASIAESVTFKGQPDGSYSHATPPSFTPVFTTGDKITFSYDLTGLRTGHGGFADGGELIVSDIDRAVPQAFPDNDLDAHGTKYPLHGVSGTITLTSNDFPHGVGTYGVALRGTIRGQEIPDSTSFWQPIRYAPAAYQLPVTPKIQAEASALNGTAPLFYEIADTEPGGSTRFAVSYDVRPVKGATGAIVEFSRPTFDFAKALFITGDFTPANSFVNNFTNPNGDRLDGGDDFGQAGETTHVDVSGTHGVATLDGSRIGLSIPAASCDATYQVRVLATNRNGAIVGVAGSGSILSYANLAKAVCES